MEYVNINGNDTRLSRIGFGGEQLGGYAWGKISEIEMIKAIHTALERGINLFDTAPIYGLGHSEEVLGRTLASCRKNVIIATKVGLVWKEDAISKKSAPNSPLEKFIDNSPANINREIDASLRRLRTDYIDIYQIHWPDANTPIENTFSAMEKLKQSGKIRFVGCCNFTLELLKESLKYSKITSIQVPYNLIDRRVGTDLLRFCSENNVAVLSYSPLGRGLLTGKYNEVSKFGLDDRRSRNIDAYFRDEALPRNLEIVERVKTIANRLNKTPSQIALRWVLENSSITSAIFGAKSVIQVEENIQALDFSLSRKDFDYLTQE